MPDTTVALSRIDEKPVPKIIWLCWLQGWENAPKLAQLSLDSWKKLNPDWEIILIDRDNISDFVNVPNFIEQGFDIAGPVVYANVIRTALLAQHGGVWTDCTTLCNKPLSDWLPKATKGTGFFMFEKPSKDRLISNWFIASSPSNYLTVRLYVENLKYRRQKIIKPDGRLRAYKKGIYFWYHRIFAQLLEADELFEQLWNLTKKISAGPAHVMNKNFYKEARQKPRDAILATGATDEVYVFKLDRKSLDAETNPIDWQTSNLEIFTQKHGLPNARTYFE